MQLDLLVLCGQPLSVIYLFFYYFDVIHRDLHSFPTRRSSDLPRGTSPRGCAPTRAGPCLQEARALSRHLTDRKSTRLNSSHVSISYAVFCLNKKKEKKI